MCISTMTTDNMKLALHRSTQPESSDVNTAAMRTASWANNCNTTMVSWSVFTFFINTFISCWFWWTSTYIHTDVLTHLLVQPLRGCNRKFILWRGCYLPSIPSLSLLFPLLEVALQIQLLGSIVSSSSRWEWFWRHQAPYVFPASKYIKKI